MVDDGLRSQLAFITRLDELKSVIRRNYLADGSRRENSAEHSWHVAMLAWVCAEQADEPVDVDKAVRMLLLHDVVEIEAGDTYVYDVEGQRDQEARERAAAEQLFGLLPPSQAAEFLALWNEYEARQTPEARYAKAIDSLLPLLQTTANGGAFWREHGITRDQVVGAKRCIADSSQALWELAQALIDEFYQRGVLK
jgi:putative hydrolase of HD superfamily